jgi:hypothetical protein
VRPRTTANLLWGAIGGLSFLVLAQGYRLVATLPVGTLSLLAIGIGVGAVTGVLAYALDARLDRSERA